MTGTILTIAGIFAGIGVFLAAMYSMTQVLLMGGMPRIAHFALFVLILTVMFSMFWWRDVGTARVLAVPLMGFAVWTLVLEQRWYRVFPLLVIVFAGLLLAGYVALTPL
jgi:hypothetical protein